MLSGKIKPLYNDEILDEYFDVLNRSKFHLSEIRIHELLNFFKENGIDSSRFPYDGEMPDEDDRVFFHHSHLYSKAVPSRTTWRRPLMVRQP